MALYSYSILAFALALVAPLALIATRHELQNVRTRIVHDLKDTLFKTQQNLPQIELVAARYQSRNGPRSTRQQEVMEWTGALFFVLVTFIGFLILLFPLKELISAEPSFPKLTSALFWTSDYNNLTDVRHSAGVAAFAFLGGYVFQTKYLIRSTINQELSALAFIRSSLSIIQGIILSVVIFRVTSPVEVSSKIIPFSGFLGLSFIFGCWPDLGLSYLSSWVKIKAKTINEKALKTSSIIPLEIIEGIDSETSYRLQESNLYDVQNLATINPIELYAETPFTIYQAFDWIIQAQLCVAVGPDTFNILKTYKIRTIFDLERAILAKGAPQEYIQALGDIIFAESTIAFRTQISKPPISPVLGASINVDVVKHAVAIIGDDLHIHRLRALWGTVLSSTSDKQIGSLWLYETDPLPGEPSLGSNLSAVAEAGVKLAEELGRAHVTCPADSDHPEKIKLRAACLQAAQDAIIMDPLAKERLRLQWNSGYLRKRPDETALEQFQSDAEFVGLLG